MATLHAICARMLRRRPTRFLRPGLAIYDTDNQQSLVSRPIARLNLDAKKYSAGRSLTHLRAKTN